MKRLLMILIGLGIVLSSKSQTQTDSCVASKSGGMERLLLSASISQRTYRYSNPDLHLMDGPMYKIEVARAYGISRYFAVTPHGGAVMSKSKVESSYNRDFYRRVNDFTMYGATIGADLAYVTQKQIMSIYIGPVIEYFLASKSHSFNSDYRPDGNNDNVEPTAFGKFGLFKRGSMSLRYGLNFRVRNVMFGGYFMSGLTNICDGKGAELKVKTFDATFNVGYYF